MMSKSYRQEVFDAVVKANTIHNFKLNFLSDSVSVDSIWNLIKFITTCTSQALVWLLAYSKPWYNIAGFASMVLLRLLNALVHVISCLTHEGSGKTLGKRNSLCGSLVLTAHLLLCCMDGDSTSHTWAIDETLKVQIFFWGPSLETQILKDIIQYSLWTVHPAGRFLVWKFVQDTGEIFTYNQIPFEIKSSQTSFAIFAIFLFFVPTPHFLKISQSHHVFHLLVNRSHFQVPEKRFKY